MKKILYLLSLTLFLTNCQAQPTCNLASSYETKIDNVPVLLSFDKKEGRFFGKIVNNYFGTFRLTGSNITLTPSGSTMMMGPENEMKVEQQWLAILPKISSFETSNNNIIFHLTDGTTIKMHETK